MAFEVPSVVVTIGEPRPVSAAHHVDASHLDPDPVGRDHAIGAATLQEVRIYFPDPWPKKRQQKRRLIQADFAALLATRIGSGGRLHLATDWAEYAGQMLAVLDASADWRNLAGTGGYSPRPPTRIETHFEKRGVRLGHGVWDLLHERS